MNRMINRVVSHMEASLLECDPCSKEDNHYMVKFQVVSLQWRKAMQRTEGDCWCGDRVVRESFSGVEILCWIKRSEKTRSAEDLKEEGSARPEMEISLACSLDCGRGIGRWKESGRRWNLRGKGTWQVMLDLCRPAANVGFILRIIRIYLYYENDETQESWKY